MDHRFLIPKLLSIAPAVIGLDVNCGPLAERSFNYIVTVPADAEPWKNEATYELFRGRAKGACRQR